MGTGGGVGAPACAMGALRSFAPSTHANQDGRRPLLLSRMTTYNAVTNRETAANICSRKSSLVGDAMKFMTSNTGAIRRIYGCNTGGYHCCFPTARTIIQIIPAPTGIKSQSMIQTVTLDNSEASEGPVMESGKNSSRIAPPPKKTGQRQMPKSPSRIAALQFPARSGSRAP